MFENFDLITILVRTGSSLALGTIIAYFYMFRSNYNKPYVVTIALLPAIVGAVIAIVNGNVGTGVAVMGAFSLVRFRSIPGTAKEISFIFFSMAVGLATGMGYIPYAAVFTLMVGVASMLLLQSKFGEQKSIQKQLKVTIPENLNYIGLFDDLFNEYTASRKLRKVKTTNMGSMFQLYYEIDLISEETEKEFIDKLRCRNGNLDIICGYISESSDVL
jgi:uncharacterized membrane protein YhiD involved in acid resistance